MKIVYNPQDGAPITSFIHKGVMLAPHYPDGFTIPGGSVVSNGLVQYEESTADEIVETYGFLQMISEEEAKKILGRPADAQHKCDYPGCEFSTATPIALAGHKRKHAKDAEEVASNPAIDPALIPVAGGTKAPALAKQGFSSDNKVIDIPNGKDKDGVEWTGEGVTIDSPSNMRPFQGVRPAGKGHFVG